MARGRGASASGRIRTVEISKGSSHFHASSLIPAAAESTFDWLAASGLGEPTIDESTFVVRAGDLLEKMNDIRPFREGSGRTQRASSIRSRECRTVGSPGAMSLPVSI